LLALLVYVLTTVAILATWHRCVQRLSRTAAIVLILMPLCFTGRALLTGRVYAPIDLPFQSEPLKDYARDYGTDHPLNGTVSDLYAQIIPWRYAVRVALTNGRWPLWNPYLFCGSILAANAQSGPYDPVNLLTLLMPFAAGITFSATLTFFLAAFFTFIFARALGCSEGAALIAGAGYAFSGSFSFFVGWPLSRTWAFFPLVMLGARLVVRETNLRAASILTLAFVLTIVAGHPESLLHIVATGAAYGAVEALVSRGRLLRAMGLAVASGAVALSLTAIFLLPFQEATRHTIEAGTRLADYSRTPLPIDRGLIARRVGATFLPFYGGQPWHGNITPLWDSQSARTGSLIVALACCSLLLSGRRRLTWGFLFLAIVSLLAGFDAPPVAQFLHRLPGFNIALNGRLAYAATLALAILAALAIDAFPFRRRGAAAVVVIVGITLALFAKQVWTGQLAAGVNASLMTSMTLAELLPLGILAVLLLTRISPRVLVLAVLAMVLLQRTFEDGGIYPTIPAASFYPGIPVVKAMKPEPEPYRMTGRYYAFVPDTAALYQLEDVRGYEAMTFDRLTDTYPLWSQAQPVSFNLITDFKRPFLSALNVRYALSSDDTNPPAGWKMAAQDRHSRLFENTGVLRRAFVPRWVHYRKSSTDILAEMAHATDFAEHGWIEAAEMRPHDIASGPGVVSTRQDGNGFLMTATMENDGWVVVSESAWPGWRAYVDDHRVTTKFADHALLGVFVPKGKHRIRLVYLPVSFTRGRAISVSTLGLLVVGWWIGRRRREDRTPPPIRVSS
jgi:hypothetical protein